MTDLRHWITVATPLWEAMTDDDPIGLLQQSEHLLNMGTYVSEGGIGFLLPNGELLVDTEGMSHRDIAEQAGTDLTAVYQSGVARIYISDDFLGIEIWQRPTPQQIKTLLKAARANRHLERFGVEGAYDISIIDEDRPISVAQIQTALQDLA